MLFLSRGRMQHSLSTIFPLKLNNLVSIIETSSTNFPDCGSLNYTAPEVLLGVPYNPKIADIWSLGVVVYILLCGRFPFLATDVTKLYREQVNKAYYVPLRAATLASVYLLEVSRFVFKFFLYLYLCKPFSPCWKPIPKRPSSVSGQGFNTLFVLILRS